MREDEDVYDLSEDDALPDDDATSHPVSSGDSEANTYELGEVSENPPRGDLELLVHPARYCKACGFDLTLVTVSPCPGCDKPFDPDDDSTTRDTPLPEQDNYWLQKPRLAGYGLLALYILGRPVIHLVGDNLGGRFADVVLAFGVLALTPWVFVGVLLALKAVEEHHNPKLTVTLPLGFAFGVLLTFGLHPGVLLVGGIAGAFAGFVRAWRET